MPILKRLISSSLLVLFLLGTASAQENGALIDNAQAPVPAAPLVTATATAKRVRFVSPGTVVQLRLEVYNEAGQKLFDTELRGGNVLDWPLQDGAGERLAAGSYACVLTIKSLSRRISQRVGLVTVNDDKATVEAARADQLSRAQQQTIGPVEDHAAFTVLQEREAEAITTVTHDGTEGQLARTRGALSFRLGDLFSAKDKEQMRLTEEGNLGVGTSDPQARLDVAGTIRAAKGIEFADGTVQTTGLSGRKDKDGNIIPNVTGTGTQNQISKWTDNSGALGNSIITELPSGFIGISNPNPTAKLSVSASAGAQLRFDQGALGITPVLSVISQPESTASGAAAILGAGTGGSSFVFSDNQPFYLLKDTKANVINNQLGNGTILFTLLPTGNVGIGNTNPAAKLDVAGNINTSTQYNIGGNRVLSVPGTNNTFAGVGAGQSHTNGSVNSFFGTFAGQSNMTGSHNSFFGTSAGVSNTTGSFNSFFGASAGAITETGSNNSFIGVGAGFKTTTGSNNSFFGQASGVSNTTGSGNVSIGASSGSSNGVENNNTFIGSVADGAAGITNATAIGFRAKVTQSNSLILGSINTVNSATADTNVGIGTTAPTERLEVVGNVKASGNLTVDSNTLHVDAANNRVGIGTNSPIVDLDLVAPSGNADFFMRAAGATKGINFGVNGDTPNATLFIAHWDGVNPAQNRLVINPDGRVGIGTESPGAKLQVAGGDAAVTTQGNGLILRATDGPLCFRLTVNGMGVLSTVALPSCP